MWTPREVTAEKGVPRDAGTRTGAPFSARLILAYGQDTEFSRRSAVFEFPDGCRRQYLVKSFAPADVEYITGQIVAHPYKADPASYATSIEEEGLVKQSQVDSGAVRTYQTQHFNIMYGLDSDGFSYTYQNSRGVPWDAFIRVAGQTLEDGWAIDRAILDAPMPYADATTKKKVNVYICGTGLPIGRIVPNGDKGDCGAMALSAAYVSSVYLQPGSTTLWHEFAHTVEYYTGGFRSASEPMLVWETNANFVQFLSSPHFDGGITWYYNNLENGPFWWVSRYGAFPIMMYLFENDATRPYAWSAWTKNLRDAKGMTKEDFAQAVVRLGKADGVFPDGYRSFADFMGWYGVRLAAGDFLNSRTLLDVRVSDYVAKLYAPLTPVAGHAYASPAARPLMQWGTHIVPLTPSGNRLTARLTGTTAAGEAAWRYFILSMAPDGTPRYSPMGTATGTANGSAISLPAVQGEKAYLVVTATPYAYQSPRLPTSGGMGQAPEGLKFPYDVTIDGATPLPLPASACNSIAPGQKGHDLNYNTNGYTDQAKPC